VRLLTAPRLALAGLLLLSLGVRLTLVFRGGQGFWPDEGRYVVSKRAVAAWEEGKPREAAQGLLGEVDHPGFKLFMVVPAWLEHRLKRELRLPATLLSLFSVANVWWVWRLARRGGAGEREALWAATAMASSCAMACWSRHLMPYDLALFWALACASFALRPEPRPRDSVLSGLLGFAAFFTYAGSWSLVACLLAAHVLSAGHEARSATRRAALGLAGLAAPFGLFLLARWMVGGHAALSAYGGFAATVREGDLDEGHRVLLEYLWSTEGVTALIWLGALSAAPWLLRGSAAADRRRAVLPLAVVLGLASILVAGSNLLGGFVVYGRLVRQVVPFCALVVGWTAVRLCRGRRSRWLEAAALAALLACGAAAMREPLRQEFPPEFRQRSERVKKQHPHAAGAPARRFRLLYAGHIYPFPNEAPAPPGSEVLLASPHPLAWRPYLYEGYTRDQRDRFAATDFSMRLVLLPR
jgi:hypothetical protein